MFPPRCTFSSLHFSARTNGRRSNLEFDDAGVWRKRFKLFTSRCHHDD